MPKIIYDLYTPPISEKRSLLDVVLYFDTSVSPIQLKGWYSNEYRIGVKFPSDGQIYLDSSFTKGLFVSGFPTTRPYDYMLALPMKNSFVGVWLGRTASDHDTPVAIAINKEIGALLIYNISSNEVQVNHYTDIYPNYETNGTYLNGVVTLQQGQYVLFYGSVKPTVNTSAPWGFTDYEPRSSSSMPSVYVDVTDGTIHLYYESTIDLNIILNYGIGSILTEINNIILYYPGLYFRRFSRGGRDADQVSHMPPGGGLAVSVVLRPNNIFPYSVYDHDPPAGVSWAEGFAIDNVSYIKDGDGIAIVLRILKTTTNPYNPRYAWALAIKYIKEDTRVRLRIASAFKSLTDIVSYGAVNQVVNPGFGTDHYSDPATYEYFDGSTWKVATPGTDSYNYYSGYGIRANLYNPLDTSVRYRYVAFMRKYTRYGTAPIKIGSIKFSSYPDKGSLVAFLDYGGATIPANNYVCMVFDAVVTVEETYPDIPVDTPVEDTAIWSYLYGLPYNITVEAPSSATPGSTITINVYTDAPDGRKVYIVDKDTDEVLASGTVSGGVATISLTMPNKTLRLRIYIEGSDITLA